MEQVAELNKKYETEKKEAQITILNSENSWKSKMLWGLGIGLLLAIAAFATILSQFRRLKIANGIIQNQANKLGVLIKELHHRVKNNLQVVSSLLSIQSDEIKDEAARKSINEGKLRVDAMSIIHQRLYMEDDLTELNLQEYVEDLIQHLAYSYGYESGDFKLHLSINPVLYNVDNALPIGLMLNEVLTNAFKYAFPNNPDPTLWVTITNNNGLNVAVKDNGKHQPTATPQGTGFGTKLIESLSYQLQAKTESKFDNGFSFILKSK